MVQLSSSFLTLARNLSSSSPLYCSSATITGSGSISVRLMVEPSMSLIEPRPSALPSCRACGACRPLVVVLDGL